MSTMSSIAELVVCLSVRLSVTRWHCVETTPATIMWSSLEEMTIEEMEKMTIYDLTDKVVVSQCSTTFY